MLDYIDYICVAIWLIGVIALFAHEIWIFCKYPEDWDKRDQGITYIPDWQVWLVMVCWPAVLLLACLYAVGIYASTNYRHLFKQR